MGDFKQEIARLRALTPELNAVTDRATKLVLAVEKFLSEECQLGIPAYIEMDEWQEDGDSVRYGTRLEYGKWEGKLRLLVCEFEAPCNGPMYFSEHTPWVNATRNKKLSTIPGIRDLMKEIGKQVERTIRDANENADDIEAYLADLGVVMMGGE